MTEIYLHFLFAHYGLYGNAPVRIVRSAWERSDLCAVQLNFLCGYRVPLIFHTGHRMLYAVAARCSVSFFERYDLSLSHSTIFLCLSLCRHSAPSPCVLSSISGLQTQASAAHTFEPCICCSSIDPIRTLSQAMISKPGMYDACGINRPFSTMHD